MKGFLVDWNDLGFPKCILMILHLKLAERMVCDPLEWLKWVTLCVCVCVCVCVWDTYTWLCWVLDEARELFVALVRSSSLIRDQTQASYVESIASQPLDHQGKSPNGYSWLMGKKTSDASAERGWGGDGRCPESSSREAGLKRNQSMGEESGQGQN